LIQTSSGVSDASALSLLNIVAPVVVGVLARIRSAQGLNAAGLATVLMNQKYFLSRQAPPGLAGVFGLRNLANLGSGLAGVVTATEPDPVRPGAVDLVRKSNTSKHWLWPVLAAGVIGLLYVGQRGGVDVTPAPLAQWTSAATPTATVSTVTLLGGTSLSLKEGSFNYNVAKFLGDITDPAVPKTFVFDRLYFDVGTTRLTAESMPTVNDLSVILKAYAAVDVRLDGHTDGVGNAKDNKKLSLDRAAAVQEALITGGIGATRITTAGYGQEYPLASSETEEGRAKNQRLELVVLKK
jgi:outer membrane protein OmpA-like peptidoglycan-associated protein